MREEYRQIIGYENLYAVSNLGFVKSIKRNKQLNIVIDRYGYPVVHLCKNHKPKYVKIHRLVAQAFIPNPNDLPEVNHKDENKLNNNVENLEWCTNKYNQTYGTVIKRRSNSNKGKHRSEQSKQAISAARKRYLAQKLKPEDLVCQS